MKLEKRERVDGTNITIGQRVYYRHGRQRISRQYAAEYRDPAGKQHCRNLATTRRAQARRLAVEIQQELERGIEHRSASRMTIQELTQGYYQAMEAKGLALKTLWKYRADLAKLRAYCQQTHVHLARQFTVEELYNFRRFLVEKSYADKTIQGAMVLAKQVFKWGHRQGKLPDYHLGAVSFPKAKAGKQPCFTTDQVEQVLTVAQGEEEAAFALMAYAGLRIGEVEQLLWEDFQFHPGQPAMIHVQRGGSNKTTKDREDRFVPLHPRAAELLEPLRQDHGAVFGSQINERKLLKRIKVLCCQCGFENPRQYKLHSLRHHFASLCANHQVAHRKVLAWLGHSSSQMLDLYYHLHDDDSRQAMLALARSHQQQAYSDGQDSTFEGNLRATGRSKIEKLLQIPEFTELTEALSNVTERAGFEPAVRENRTLVFETSSFSHSDTSPSLPGLPTGRGSLKTQGPYVYRPQGCPSNFCGGVFGKELAWGRTKGRLGERRLMVGAAVVARAG